MHPGRRCTGGFAAGSVMAPGRRSWPCCRHTPMLLGRSAGWWAWTPRSAVRISTRRVPVVTVTGRRNRSAGWRASRTITAWAVRVASGPPRRIWRASRVARCWRWWCPVGSAATARSSSRCWAGSGWRGSAVAGRGLVRTGSWPTRRRPAGPTGRICAGSGSRRASRARPIRTPIAARRGPRAGGHPPSDGRSRRGLLILLGVALELGRAVPQCARVGSTGRRRRPPRSAAEYLAEIPPDTEVDLYGQGGVVCELEAEVAQILAKPAAAFLPSGVMAQQIALRIHADRRGRRTVVFHPLCHLEQKELRAYQRLHALVGRPVGEPHRLLTVGDLLVERWTGELAAEPPAVLLLELPQRDIGGQLPGGKSWSPRSSGRASAVRPCTWMARDCGAANPSMAARWRRSRSRSTPSTRPFISNWADSPVQCWRARRM